MYATSTTYIERSSSDRWIGYKGAIYKSICMHGIYIIDYIIDCMQSVSDRGITQIHCIRTGLAGEVTVTRERDVSS
jgi:hypothetical protein